MKNAFIFEGLSLKQIIFFLEGENPTVNKIIVTFCFLFLVFFVIFLQKQLAASGITASYCKQITGL